MKIILQKDVKDLGKAGDLINVKPGFARNYLYPRKLALRATEGKIKQWNHLKRLADAKRRQAEAARRELIDKLKDITLSFKVTAAGETDKIFGSVTNIDISKELDKQGFEVDKRDINLEEPIKMLGQHKAQVKLGDGMETDLTISVERA